MRSILKETLLILVILFIPMSSAEIKISHYETLYNFGDNFNMTITISPKIDTSDFLIANLVCGGDEVQIYKGPASISGGEQKEFSIETRLEKFLVRDLSGICLIKAAYGNEESKTQTFELTSDVKITIKIDGFVFNPSDTIYLSGQAYKSTGEKLDGFIDITLHGTNTTFSDKVGSGNFDLNFTIPNDHPPGDFYLSAKAYDKDSSGNVMNQGTITEAIRINRVIRKIEIAINEQNIQPRNELIYTIVLYDQAGNNVEKEITVSIYTMEEIFKKELVKSGIANIFIIESNYTPGNWKIEAVYENLKTTKIFFVEQFEEISSELDGNTLTLINTGNVPYVKPIGISIGDVDEIKDLNLPVGASKKFKLHAPDGEYEIGINDGSEKRPLGTTILTGNVISVDDLGGMLTGNLKVLIWIVLILAIAVIALFIYRKISKNKFIGKSEEFKPLKVNIETKPIAKDKELGYNIIDQGEKQESNIISLKIKNMDSLNLNQTAIKTIDGALWKAKEAGAKIYSDNDYRIVVFSPILTKEKDNTLKTITIAQTIERMLKEYNKRNSQKIEFGIGVNVGNLIVESKSGKFRFISLDNTIAATKRISQHSNFDVLISEALHRKTVGKMKTRKLEDKNLWRLERIQDRSEHKEFIRKFSERQR